LTPNKEIEREIDPLWSIEIRQKHLGVCKDLAEGVILEVTLLVSVRLQ
jgi:hypothetical protein